MKKKLLITLLLMPLMANANPPDFKGFHIVKNSQGLKAAMPSKEGFVNTTDQDQAIDFLLRLKSHAASEIKEFQKNTNPYDTHLKASLSDIKLSIPFNGLSVINNKELIGYAPIGSYENGWTGIRVFFEKSDFGVCSYSYEKFVGINADQSSVNYLVNKKPSFKSIEGNYNTGFLYTVSWDEDNKTSVYDHKLECANKNMSQYIIDRMVVLANQIDKK